MCEYDFYNQQQKRRGTGQMTADRALLLLLWTGGASSSQAQNLSSVQPVGGGQPKYRMASLVLWSTSGYLETCNILSAVSVTLNKWRQLFYFLPFNWKKWSLQLFGRSALSLSMLGLKKYSTGIVGGKTSCSCIISYSFTKYAGSVSSWYLIAGKWGWRLRASG